MNSMLKTPPAAPLADSSLLITGGTGSFGQRLLFTLLDQHQPRRIVIFSRDELKQYELQQKLLDHPLADRVRFFLGDVRDRDRLVRQDRLMALEGLSPLPVEAEGQVIADEIRARAISAADGRLRRPSHRDHGPSSN